MTKYLKVDLQGGYGICLCDTKDELFEGCGYDVDEITFEDFCEQLKGEYDIVEVTGDFKLKCIVEEDDY
jgi:hypothetical protein